ncbi:MAG: hypothetical protein WCW65_03260 [Candidatus Paceibacterota bacterium]
MDVTILVAKILAIYMIVSGFFLLIKGNSITNMMKDFFGHPALIYLTSIILIFLSSLYLLQYSIWDGTSRMIVTIFAWIIFIKGITYIFFPQLLSQISIKKYQKYFALYGVIAIFAGLYLFTLK